MLGRHSRYVVFIVAALACGDRSGEQGAESGEQPAPSRADTAEQGAMSGERTTPPPAGLVEEKAIENLNGRILMTGPDPGVVTLQLADGSSVNLVGDFERELHNLSGATVSVEGRRTSDHPTLGTFDVYGYEISSIDGAKPEVGIFESYETSWFLLVDDKPVALADVPDGLKTHDGAKVWIVGERTRTRLRVQSYGIIRER